MRQYLSGLVALCVALPLAHGSALAAGNAAELIAQCDVLTGSPYDELLPEDFSPVPFAFIDADAANLACAAAAATGEAPLRTQYGWGRALDAAGDFVGAYNAYRIAADGGYPMAMRALGVLLAEGTGVAEADAAAFDWFQRAAAAGSVVALSDLGYAYANGEGVEVDDAVALDYFERAAAAGIDSALTYLGYMYTGGIGVGRDDAKGVAYYEAAADLEDAEALLALGLMHYSGTSGLAVDSDLARSLLQRAVDQGSTDAMEVLGAMYLPSRGLEPDADLAAFWFDRAVEGRDAYQIIESGNRFEYANAGYPRDEYAAAELYRRAAALGGGEGYYQLGRMLYDYPQLDPDPFASEGYFERAFQFGDLSYAYQVGTFYETVGLRDEALRWYERGAGAGDVGAILRLALSYHFGLAVDAQPAKAAGLYEQAAVLGGGEAMLHIAYDYYFGTDELDDYEPDLEMALSWFKRAEAAGQTDAVRYVEVISSALYGFTEQRRADKTQLN
ncbi:MAG: Sel1 protein [Devosia sp.]|nr:Sel1 protein [Devosia sp.]